HESRAPSIYTLSLHDALPISTIGITPTEPAIGFGYIHCGGRLDLAGAPSAFAVDSFVEKPTLAVAKRYLSEGDYLWNGGMFISRDRKSTRLNSSHVKTSYAVF